LPNERTGWVLLHAEGGHPGNNPDFAAIRRWTAPSDGALTIDGTLSHGSPNGDGVRARVVASSLGIAGEWLVHNGQTPTAVEKINVSVGDTIDFITDCREHVASDSFAWHVALSLKKGDGVSTTFRSNEGFHGPLGQQATLKIENILRAWQLAYLRLPTRDELRAACEFISRQCSYLRIHPEYNATGRSPEAQALTNLCHALLSSNEFLYAD
jgi:hypothetical protein